MKITLEVSFHHLKKLNCKHFGKKYILGDKTLQPSHIFLPLDLWTLQCFLKNQSWKTTVRNLLNRFARRKVARIE